MTRDEIMKEALKSADPIKKGLYKMLASELDRGFDDPKVTFLSVVKKMIKSTKQLHQDDVTRYELKLLHNLMPQPIDLEKEFKQYLGNATSDKSVGGTMKYFKEEFDGRYDAKKLSNIARAEFQKDYPKRKEGGI